MIGRAISALTIGVAWALAIAVVTVAAAGVARAAAPGPVGPPPDSGCWVVNAQYGVACACTAEYCDYSAGFELQSDEVVAYASVGSDSTQRLTKQSAPLYFEAASKSQQFQIRLDRGTTHQSILGFGGALTDAVAYNFYQLTSGLQQQIITQYYSSAGLEYSMARTHLGSCDFSLHSYSYDDVPGYVSVVCMCCVAYWTSD